MSVHVSSLVWKLGGVSAAEKLVLLKLADNANDAGNCWPSLATITRETCLSRATVCRAIKAIGKRGLVSHEFAHRKSNQYTIELTTIKAALESHHDTSLTMTLVSPRDGGSVMVRLPPSHHDTLGSLTMTPQPSIEPSIEPSIKSSVQLRGKPPKLTDDEFLETLKSAYVGIDVSREHGKAMAWCAINRRHCTRRFFTGWLNRIEAPMAAAKSPPKIRRIGHLIFDPTRPLTPEQCGAEFESFQSAWINLKEQHDLGELV